VPEPDNKLFEGEVVGLVQTADENIGVVGVGRNAGAIDG
jgi:hypothetical protein